MTGNFLFIVVKYIIYTITWKSWYLIIIIFNYIICINLWIWIMINSITTVYLIYCFIGIITNLIIKWTIGCLVIIDFNKLFCSSLYIWMMPNIITTVSLIYCYTIITNKIINFCLFYFNLISPLAITRYYVFSSLHPLISVHFHFVLYFLPINHLYSFPLFLS